MHETARLLVEVAIKAHMSPATKFTGILPVLCSRP